MTVTWLTAFLDSTAADAEAVDQYWVGVTGWSPSLVPPDGHPVVKLPVVGRPPPNGMHRDVHTDDVSKASDAARRLGASIDINELGYAVGHSPGGLAFCLVPHEAGQRPKPTRWPSGTSLVDQVCLDIPQSRFAREAPFWAALTRWSWAQALSKEFDRLLAPPGQPLQVLVQRLEEPDGPVRIHLDLSSEDRAAEVARHVALGGRVVRETPWWTTLLDPSGRAYCVTDRDPATGRLP